jgi:hypothetical protein
MSAGGRPALLLLSVHSAVEGNRPNAAQAIFRRVELGTDCDPFMLHHLYAALAEKERAIAAPRVLPSALGDGLGLRHFQNFRGSISHPTQLLCTLRGHRRPAGHATVATGRGLALTRTGLAPAGSDHLILTHPQVLDGLNGNS